MSKAGCWPNRLNSHLFTLLNDDNDLAITRASGILIRYMSFRKTDTSNTKRLFPEAVQISKTAVFGY